MKYKVWQTLIYGLICGSLFSQKLNHSIEGHVFDTHSGAPLSYVTVLVLDTDPPLGGITDQNGKFTIPEIPLGRYDIQFSFVGYEPLIVREVVVSSAQSAILEARLTEQITRLDEVIVRPRDHKSTPLNSMASVSTRVLSVEEANRYAGGFDDPARLASALAGVASNVGHNGIAIRGNAPRMLQWKMEGVEIPNPNHFADLNSFGGGGLTALSSHLLANSDFFTGAFPAEYNNALSGVFDISMREGTANDHLHNFQVGLIGIDLASEGPINRKKNSSYIANYRYSTLGLLQPLLPEDAEKISYQDLAFKFRFPTKKAGIFKFWGIALQDESGQVAIRDSSQWMYLQDREEGSPQQYMGAAGFSHQYFFGSNTNIKSTIATTISGLDWNMQRLNRDLDLMPHSNIHNNQWNLIFNSALTSKISPTHTLKTGISVTNMSYDLLVEEAGASNLGWQSLANQTGSSTLAAAFASSQLRVSDRWKLNLGLNSQYFTLNKRYTLEPRLGVTWKLDQQQSFALAYGLHSRLERLQYYFSRSFDHGESNRKLDFAKAHHLVLKYDRRISENIFFRLEPYFQSLFRVPVVEGTPTSFINLQDDWFFRDVLVNKGKGRNYGIDVTFERYLSDGLYYLITGSWFRSEYLGGDHIWRRTAFDRKYLVNGLIGKEWYVGKDQNNVFGINLRATLQGGEPYTPIDQIASIREEDVVHNQVKAFSKQNDRSFIFHFTLNYKMNRPRTAQEISLKVLNATNQPDFLGFRYNYRKQRAEKHLEAIMIPNLSYKISF